MKKIRRGINRIRCRVAAKLSIAGAHNSWALRLLYLALDASYLDEQRAFVAGIKEYKRSLHHPTESFALLRRNVHRIEKGLLMRPRRIPFARDYISETVDAFEMASSSNSGIKDTDEFKWAYEVLTKYFELHKDVSEIQDLLTRFEKASTKEEKALGERVPYHRDLQSPVVRIEELESLAYRRRSVRWFLPKKVDRTLVDRAIMVGTQAPSACNRQPFQFKVFDDPELVKKLITIPYGLVGYGHNVPVIIAVVGKQRNFFDPRDRHLIYIDSSLAVMGFLYALEAQGLSSCCVNWPDIPSNELQIRELLKLDPDERTVMLIAVGHPDPEGMVAYSSKKPLSQIRTYNFE